MSDTTTPRAPQASLAVMGDIISPPGMAGKWREIDLQDHSSAFLGVWTMENWPRTERCEHQVERMVLSWNACRELTLDELQDDPLNKTREDRDQLLRERQDQAQLVKERDEALDLARVQSVLLGGQSARLAKQSAKLARQKLAMDRMSALLLYLVSQDGPQPGSADWVKLVMRELHDAALTDITDMLAERLPADDTEGGNAS